MRSYSARRGRYAGPPVGAGVLKIAPTRPIHRDMEWSVSRVFMVAVILLSAVSLAPAQDSDGAASDEDAYLEYEEAIRDLVERYEETRELLRREIERNADLYTQEELDDAVTAVEGSLGAELTEARTRLEELEDAVKGLRVSLKNAQDEARGFKADLAKTVADSDQEVAGLESTLAAIEEESLIQVGATFSPAGSLGAIGILNLPDTNVSLLAGADYALRDRAVSARFGVTLSFLPQQQIITGWNRATSIFRRPGNGTSDTDSVSGRVTVPASDPQDEPPEDPSAE